MSRLILNRRRLLGLGAASAGSVLELAAEFVLPAALPSSAFAPPSIFVACAVTCFQVPSAVFI